MNSLQMEQLVALSIKAGRAIMDIYETDYTVEQKEDQSPLTEADKASHQIICEKLQQLYPNIPILSEEGKHTPYEERKHWKRFWLVDPLDGTKEFIKKNGEFTVNIALIEGQYPIAGVVHIPVTGATYVGTPEGSFLIDEKGQEQPIHVKPEVREEMTLVESRSHPSPEMDALLTRLGQHYKEIHRMQRGSSLKLCAVAEGAADFYPRLGPTMEWDVAAGQSVIEGAGGQVVDLQGARFQYNKENLLNGHFLAIGVSCFVKVLYTS